MNVLMLIENKNMNNDLKPSHVIEVSGYYFTI